MKSSKISMTDFGRMVTSSVGFKMPNERYESLDSFNGPNVSGNLTIHDLWASNYKADYKEKLKKSVPNRIKCVSKQLIFKWKNIFTH